MKSMLTKKQKEVLDFIKSYMKKNDYSPTLQEIADHLDVSTVSTIHEHLEKLEKKGYIEMKNNQPRSIKPVEKKSNDTVTIPFLGTITAGEPIEAIENPKDFKVSKSMLSSSGEHFALKVKGESMIEEGIQDGDIVIVRDQPKIENGQTAVAYLPDRNEATLKKIYKKDDGWKLEPANPDMEPFKEKVVEIKGKVVNIIRQFKQ